MQHNRFTVDEGWLREQKGGSEELGLYTQRVKTAWLCLDLAIKSHSSIWGYGLLVFES